MLVNSCVECPTDWKIFKGACIKTIKLSNMISWNEARSQCLKENSDLFELDYKRFFEYAELFSIFSKEKAEFYVC